MIFISNSNEYIHDFKEKLKSFEIIHIDCYEIKKNIKSELINTIYSSNYSLHKKKIYVFTNSDLISHNQLNYLFEKYYKIKENKDIYLFNIGTNVNYIKKKFKRKFKYYNNDPKKNQDDFFSQLKKILCLNKNRSNLIDYDNSNINLKYLFAVISYNLYNIDNFDIILNNIDVINNLNKYLYKINKSTIYAILDHCYKPLILRKIDFPPKKEKVESIKNDQKKSLSEDDVKEIVSEEFMEELGKRSNKSIRVSNSLF